MLLCCFFGRRLQPRFLAQQLPRLHPPQAAYEIREAAERRQHQLSESLAAAETRAGELEEQNEALQRAAESAQRQVRGGR